MTRATIETGLGKLQREALVRDCIRSCRGEGWTIRYDLQLDVWHVRQLGDDLTMGLPGLAFFSGRHTILQCRKCGSEIEEPKRGGVENWIVDYDICGNCGSSAELRP